MRLDRNTNTDKSGKYAVVKLRKLGEVDYHLKAPLQAMVEAGLVDLGNTPETEFIVIRLKDKYAAPALRAYAKAAIEDDPEYANEILDLALRAQLHPLKRKPD